MANLYRCQKYLFHQISFWAKIKKSLNAPVYWFLFCILPWPCPLVPIKHASTNISMKRNVLLLISNWRLWWVFDHDLQAALRTVQNQRLSNVFRNSKVILYIFPKSIFLKRPYKMILSINRKSKTIKNNYPSNMKKISTSTKLTFDFS